MNKNTKRQTKFFYTVREKHPTYRVDLTELFSNGIVHKGFAIDWHMRSNDAAKPEHIHLNENESVYTSSKPSSNGVIARLLYTFFSFVHDLKAYKIFMQGDYDFVQIRDKVIVVFWLYWAAKKKSVPMYYWLSFPHYEADISRAKEIKKITRYPAKVFYYVRGSFLNFFLYRFVLKKADFIFVQSDQMLKDLASQGVPENKMLPVPMGVNLHSIPSYEIRPGTPQLPEDKKVLLYLGTMIGERRIDFLIEMMPKILASHPDALLLLVGDAPKKDMDFLKSRVKELNIEASVSFTGFVPMEKAWRYVQESYLGLSPFRPTPILNSASPTKLNEYMACSIPVVANHHPDQTKVINESGGGFAVEYNTDAFAQACIELLDKPEMAKKMGIKGRKYAEEVRAYEAITESVFKKYVELLRL